MHAGFVSANLPISRIFKMTNYSMPFLPWCNCIKIFLSITRNRWIKVL